MATPFPALHLQPSPFNPAGMLQAASQIQDQRTRNELAQFNLASARERQDALRAFGDAGGIGSPNALRHLARLPDLYSQALTGMNAQQQMFALLNARGAQRVLGFPAGSSERRAAWREELSRARADNRIDDTLYNRFSAITDPDDMVLNGIIDQATPLSGGLNQRQILSLFGFGNDQTAPPPNNQPPPLRDLTEVPGITLEDFGSRRRALRDIPGVTLENNGGGLEDVVPGVLSPELQSMLQSRSNLYQPSPNAPPSPPPLRSPLRPPIGSVPSGMRQPNQNEIEWLRGAADDADRTYRSGVIDRLFGQGTAQRILSESPPTAPPGNPNGLLLPIDPAAIGRLADRQTAPPPDAPPPGDFTRAINESMERITPPPSLQEQPAAPPPNRQPPASGPTGGLQGLRGAIQNMSQEQRLAAMLLMLKGEYGELAKMITGNQSASDQAAAQARGRALGEAQAALPQALQAGQSMLNNIDAIINDPNIGSITGWEQWGPFRWLPYSPAGQTSLARVDQVLGQSFLQAYQALRGAGQISEAEGAKAQAAIARLGNLQQDDAGYMEALRDARREIHDLMNLARVRAGQREVPYSESPGLGNPSGTPDAQGWITLPNGVRFREQQ